VPTPLPWPLLPEALLLPKAVQRQALQHAVPPAVLPRPALPSKVPQALLPTATQGQCGWLRLSRCIACCSAGVHHPEAFRSWLFAWTVSMAQQPFSAQHPTGMPDLLQVTKPRASSPPPSKPPPPTPPPPKVLLWSEISQLPFLF
jgi:hypothetical protein